MEARLLVFIAFACAVSGIEGVTITQGTPNITRSGCGTSKLCFTSCDPSVTSPSCNFGSSQISSDNNSLIFELSGVTSGFVALGLDPNQTQGTTFLFLCINNNASGNFSFLSASNQNTSNPVNTVNSAQGVTNQSYIQCTFNATASLTTTTRSSATSFFISIFNGTMNGTSVGPLNSLFSSANKVDLSNASASIIPFTGTTGTTATPGSGGDSLASPAARALAVLLSALGVLLLY